MNLTGNLVQIKSRIDASGNKVNTISLVVHGDIPALHGIMEKALSIILNEEVQRAT